jgi:transposase
MSEITTIGLDLAKHVFQVHGIDAQGTTVLRKRLWRGQVLAFFSRIPRCAVGLEAPHTRTSARKRCGGWQPARREPTNNVDPTTIGRLQ